ncbi:MAG: hypothetical protein WC340_17855 [Kiritimatiellia bacterium]
MKCDEMTIAPWQVLIKGLLVQQGESFSGKGYRSYKMRILGGPSDYQQYFEVELRPDEESKHKEVKDGVEVEALCWVNGRLWNDKVFTNLALIHLTVPENAVPDEAEESDTGWIDDLRDEDELPF